MDEKRTYGFEPLLCDNPRIVILGTLPGQESLRENEYYYSNSNRIWKVLCLLKNEPTPTNYNEKKQLLAKYHIALWDYYESAIRIGSCDNKISDARPVDICGFLSNHPTINTIAINGFGKYKKFGNKIRKKVKKVFPNNQIRVLRMPETSGVNANHGWGDLNVLAKEWNRIFE